MILIFFIFFTTNIHAQWHPSKKSPKKLEPVEVKETSESFSIESQTENIQIEEKIIEKCTFQSFTKIDRLTSDRWCRQIASGLKKVRDK